MVHLVPGIEDAFGARELLERCHDGEEVERCLPRDRMVGWRSPSPCNASRRPRGRVTRRRNERRPLIVSWRPTVNVIARNVLREATSVAIGDAVFDRKMRYRTTKTAACVD